MTLRYAIDIASLGTLAGPRVIMRLARPQLVVQAAVSPMRGSVDELEAVVRAGPPR